ncbi:hypothetical protein CARUB_v100127851mg, partial [Capsella rubella]
MASQSRSIGDVPNDGVVEEYPPNNIHIPAGLLAKIVSLVGEDGVDSLKNWIKAGPEGKEAVFSKETLSTVRLEKSEDFLWWSMPNSIYHNFYSKCLAENNMYANWAYLNKAFAFETLMESYLKNGRWSPYPEISPLLQTPPLPELELTTDDLLEAPPRQIR